jgi:hypothetical protein
MNLNSNILDGQTFAKNPPYKKNMDYANIFTKIYENNRRTPIILNIPHNIKHNTKTPTP